MEFLQIILHFVEIINRIRTIKEFKTLSTRTLLPTILHKIFNHNPIPKTMNPNHVRK